MTYSRTSSTNYNTIIRTGTFFPFVCSRGNLTHLRLFPTVSTLSRWSFSQQSLFFASYFAKAGFQKNLSLLAFHGHFFMSGLLVRKMFSFFLRLMFICVFHLFLSIIILGQKESPGSGLRSLVGFRGVLIILIPFLHFFSLFIFFFPFKHLWMCVLFSSLYFLNCLFPCPIVFQ